MKLRPPWTSESIWGVCRWGLPCALMAACVCWSVRMTRMLGLEGIGFSHLYELDCCETYRRRPGQAFSFSLLGTVASYRVLGSRENDSTRKYGKPGQSDSNCAARNPRRFSAWGSAVSMLSIFSLTARSATLWPSPCFHCALVSDSMAKLFVGAKERRC